MNKCVSTSLPFVSQDDLLSLKPDVVLLKGSDCVIVEVSCPYDLYANEVYDEKRRNYMLHCLKKLNVMDLGVPLNL